MLEADFPKPIDGNVKLWDRYTVGDVITLLSLMLLGWYFAYPIGTVAGFITGVAIAELTPDGTHIAGRVYTSLRLAVGRGFVTWPGFDEVLSNAIVLDSGAVIGIVQVSSCDLEMLSESEQQANWAVVNDLLNTLDYSVEMHARQRTVDLSTAAGPEESAIATDHFVVVKVPSTSRLPIKGRVRLLAERCNEIRTTLTAADLHATRLTGDAFKRTVKRIYFRSATVSRRRYELEREAKPVHRLLYVSEYPEKLKVGWLANVLNVESPGLVDIVQVASPITPLQRKRLNRTRARLQAEQAKTNSPARADSLRRRTRDAGDLADAEASGEALLNYGVYIIARGETPGEADATIDAVKSQLRGFHVETEEPVRQMGKAVKAESAFHFDRLRERLIVPGWAAASGFPFAAYDTVNSGGVVMGQDDRSGMAVALDRFRWDTGHIGVMGKSGAGKSYWTALMLLRSVQTYDDLEIYIIDPKRRDYGSVIDDLSGTTVVLDSTHPLRTPDTDVVRYTVTDPARDNTDQLVEAVRHVYHEAAQTDTKTLVVIDEAHRIITTGNQICEDGLHAVSTIVRESRDRNIAVTLVTQNANEWTRSDEGGNILRNTDCNLFFKRRDVDDEIPDFFNFSSIESIDILKLKSGNEVPHSEALIQGPVNTKLKIDATTAEHATIEGSGTDEPTVEGETALVRPDADDTESTYLPVTRDKTRDGTGDTA